MKMEKNTMSCIITITLFLTLISGPPSSVVSKEDIGLVSPLIHRSSPKSPFYDPNASPESLRRAAIWASKARSRYFAQRASFRPPTAYYDDGHDFSRVLTKSPIYPFGQYTDYVLKFGIGMPPLETYWEPDTGSSLMWLQCLPCRKCYNQTTPLYDPEKSSSYGRVFCETDECEAIRGNRCEGGDNKCTYEIQYQDGSSSIGIAAEETMMFLNEDPRFGNINFTNMLFGCGHTNLGSWLNPSPAGIAGMDRDPISLVGQIGNGRFSYCISSNRNTSIGHSMLRFGLAAVVLNVSTTPLLSPKNTNYYVQVDDISVAGVPLNIPKWVFRINEDGTTGFIIDTGTTNTVLEPTAYGAVINAVKKFMKDKHGRDPALDPGQSALLCYNDVSNGPAITIMFKGLPFEITQKNTWEEISAEMHCLAILIGDAVSILGMYQQRDVNVGFDLKNNFVSLHDAVCPLIPDGSSSINI